MVLARQILHQPDGGAVGDGLGEVVPAGGLLGAEIGAVEDLLQADDLRAGGGRLLDVGHVLLDHGASWWLPAKHRGRRIGGLDQRTPHDTRHESSIRLRARKWGWGLLSAFCNIDATGRFFETNPFGLDSEARKQNSETNPISEKWLRICGLAATWAGRVLGFWVLWGGNANEPKRTHGRVIVDDAGRKIPPEGRIALRGGDGKTVLAVSD